MNRFKEIVLSKNSILIDTQELKEKLNIPNALKKYEKEIKREYSRERSWELCHDTFKEAILKADKCSDEKKRQLAVELACYLASFGMYRNSLLLNVNYMALLNVVSEIVDVDNKILLINAGSNIERITTLSKTIEKKLNVVKNLSDSQRSVTSTLISKIMHGTLGCTVAYDDVVCKRLKQLFSQKSTVLSKFSHDSINFLYSIHDCLNIHSDFKSFDGLTPMREMDIVLWFGRDEESSNK